MADAPDVPSAEARPRACTGQLGEPRRRAKVNRVVCPSHAVNSARRGTRRAVRRADSAESRTRTRALQDVTRPQHAGARGGSCERGPLDGKIGQLVVAQEAGWHSRMGHEIVAEVPPVTVTVAQVASAIVGGAANKTQRSGS